MEKKERGGAPTVSSVGRWVGWGRINPQGNSNRCNSSAKVGGGFNIHLSTQPPSLPFSSQFLPSPGGAVADVSILFSILFALSPLLCAVLLQHDPPTNQKKNLQIE